VLNATRGTRGLGECVSAAVVVVVLPVGMRMLCIVGMVARGEREVGGAVNDLDCRRRSLIYPSALTRGPVVPKQGIPHNARQWPTMVASAKSL
jgi:hypothetical protein